MVWAEHVVSHDAGRVHLAWAARAGDVAAVRALLEYKDAKDEGGFSALHWAVSQVNIPLFGSPCLFF